MNSRSKSKTIFNTTLVLVYFNTFLYATCFQMQKPLEPFLVEKLKFQGDSLDEYARLQSFFSFVQAIGSLISGKLLDTFGVKIGFIVSYLASALCYGFLSQSKTLSMLYVSKIPTIFQSGFLCAQLSASNITSDGAERVQALGRLTVSYTIGSVFGPFIGGYLGASGDYYLGAKIAVVGSLLSTVLVVMAPESSHEQNGPYSGVDSFQFSNKKECETVTNENKKLVQNDSMFSLIKIVWFLLLTKLLSSITNAVSATALPLVLKDMYGLNEYGMGLSMSAMSSFNAFTNAFFLGPIVSWAGGNMGFLITLCLTIMSSVSSLQAFFAAPLLSQVIGNWGLILFLGLTFILSMTQYVLASTITAESTARVSKSAKGTLLGIEHSIFAIARIFTPQVGVKMLKAGGVMLVSGSCAMMFAIILAGWFVPHISIQSFFDKKEIEQKEK